MGETRPTRTWERLRLTKPGPAPFTASIVAVPYNTGTAGVWLQCSCGCELGYDDDDGEVPLDQLNADAAEHLRSHGQTVT